jgi:hypothetical protein
MNDPEQSKKAHSGISEAQSSEIAEARAASQLTRRPAAVD